MRPTMTYRMHFRSAAALIAAASVVLTIVLPSTVASASVLYNITLSGDSTAVGTLEWAAPLSTDGAFPRAFPDISSLSITVAGVTFTEANELGPGIDAEYEVEGGQLVRFDATLQNGPDTLLFGIQSTGDGGLSSNDWTNNALPPFQLSGTYTITPVPEPSTLVLAGLSLATLIAFAWRRKR